MEIEIIYEYENDEKSKRKLQIDKSTNLVIKNILDLFNDRNVENPKMWLFHIPTMTWIMSPNDIVLNYLIKAFIEEMNNDFNITLLIRETLLSPNSTPFIEISDNISVSNYSLNSNNDNSEFTIGNNLEPFSQEEIDNMDKSTLIYIPSIQYENIIFGIDSDYIINFVKSELYRGEAFFDISLNFENNEIGTFETIIFTKQIWTKIFIRDNINSEKLLDFFSMIFEKSISYEKEIKLIHKNIDLSNRLKLFINDLTKFNSNKLSRTRLQDVSAIYPNYYFSTFHFTEDEIEYLINFPTSSGLILKDLLDCFIADKIKEGAQEICTSHDIAPIMYKTFGISKNFDKDKTYITFAKKFKGL
jgi:hypothetical protein